MDPDVLQARGLLQAILADALAANKEFTAALSALAVEEQAARDALGAALVPGMSEAEVRRAAEALDADALLPLAAAWRAADERTRERRLDLVDVTLEPEELSQISQRRRTVDQRLEEVRLHQRQRRLGAAAAPSPALEQLVGKVQALEAERNRLEALAARHRHARQELQQLDDEVTAERERLAAEARDLAVAAAIAGERTLAQDAAAALARVRAACARRAVLWVLYESWVRPHGMTLLALDKESHTVSGFETVSFPAKVRLITDDARVAVGSFRDRCPHIMGAPAADVVGDWWLRLVGDVPRPDPVVFAPLGALPPLPGINAPAVMQADAVEPVSDDAGDRLAAAWAALRHAETAVHPVPTALASDGSSPEHLTPGERLGASAADGDEDPGVLPHPPLDLDALFSTTPPLSDQLSAGAEVDDGGRTLATPVGATLVMTRGPGAASAAGMSPPALSESPQTSVFADVGPPGSAPTRAASQTFMTPGRRDRPLRPGDLVGRFRIRGLIGRGGMGEVYRAELEGAAGFTRDVVLKRIIATDDDRVLRSFVREAEVAARISHPNVISIFDLQLHDDEPFMVMEHLTGMSLQRLATRVSRAGQAIPHDVVARLMLDAARGLEAAHTMRGRDGELVGLVHRDISPDNLFLCQSGTTKLLDFGIAQQSNLTTMTGRHELRGKIPYMSPEQIIGEPLDARSDLFSLGSTLYFLLGGRRPFAGDNEMSTLYAVVHSTPPPLSLATEARALVELVEQLMQKRREDRPGAAAEVVRALHPLASTLEDAAAYLAAVEAM